MSARLLFALMVLVSTAPCRASAQGSFVEQSADGIHVKTACIMPKALNRGYVPVKIEINNRRETSAELELQLGALTSWTDNVKTIGTVKLEPGETKHLDWLAYIMPSNRSYGATRLRALEGLRTIITMQVHQLDSSSSSKTSSPLLVASNQPNESAKRLNGISFGKTAIRAEGCLPSDLPTDWRAYSALRFVALDLSGALPEAAQLEAILDWVSTGGVLLLLGTHSQAVQLLSSQDSLLGENALISGPDEQHPNNRLVYRHQFGRIAHASNDEPLTSATTFFASTGWNFPAGFADTPGPPSGTLPSKITDSPLAIPGLRSTPVAILLATLFAFGIIVGPVQFRRQKRKSVSPFRFLIVTPLLGFGFSIAILLFSLLRQGLDVKEASIGITWLDQRSHKATTLAKRVTFSGSVFRNNLHYSGRTLATPSGSELFRDPKEYIVNMDRGGTLEGFFLPVRVPVPQVIATVANARGRIEFEIENKNLYVINGLDVQVNGLTYRNSSGEYFRLAEGHSLNPGARTLILPTLEIPNFYIPELSVTNDAGVPKEKEQGALFPHLPPVLPLRTYAAELADTPFLEDGGVERNVLAQSHLLFGTLPEEKQ